MAGSLVLTGAHVVAIINGRMVGRVIGFAWTKRRPIRRAQGVDLITASELIPGPVAGDGQIRLVRTRRDGGAEGAGLIPAGPDLTREQYVSILLRDRVSDTVVARFDQCLIASEGWNVEPKNIISASLSFEGIDVTNEVLARGAG